MKREVASKILEDLALKMIVEVPFADQRLVLEGRVLQVPFVQVMDPYDFVVPEV